MVRSSLVAEIAAEEKKIVEMEQNTVFSKAYKDRTIAISTAHIANMKEEVRGYDKMTNQSQV